MPTRSAYVNLHLDTNRINARQRLVAVNQLEKWAAEDVVDLWMSEVAHEEARSGGNADRTRKTLGYIYSMTQSDSEEEGTIRIVLAILSPAGEPDENTRRDAEIVFNAIKYVAILVTADKLILQHRQELAGLGAKIMSDEEAVSHVREKIRERDLIAQMVAGHTGLPLPGWVGKD